MSKYTCNENYFEVIDTPNKAYWLGFLYADGYVSKNAKVLSITLCAKDRNHLQKFLDDLQSDTPIRDRISTCNNKEYYSSRVDIYSSKICNDLINKGCIPQKTYVITLPNEQQVPHELMRDFLRGFFDGDGSITFSSVNDKKYWIAEISGMEAMLCDIQRYLLNEAVVMTATKIHPSKKSLACTYSVNGESCMKFLSYMYDNAVVYLDRKYELYCEVLESFKTRKKYGVSWHKIRKKYQAYISDNKKIIYLGLFDTYEDAVKAREEAEILKLQKEKALLVSNG